jgi:hypothetical protein
MKLVLRQHTYNQALTQNALDGAVLFHANIEERRPFGIRVFLKSLVGMLVTLLLDDCVHTILAV